MTATTARQALICCFATLLIADQSKTHDISGNLPSPTRECATGHAAFFYGGSDKNNTVLDQRAHFPQICSAAHIGLSIAKVSYSATSVAKWLNQANLSGFGGQTLPKMVSGAI
jgi:hypothetical protein